MSDLILESEAIHPPKGPRLILGSASPRRLALLGQIGLEPDEVQAPDIDETPRAKEKPRAYAQRMAREKAEALEAHFIGDFIVTGDTVVSRGASILPKAESLDEAKACLTALSGRSHTVFSALTVITATGQIIERLSQNRVTFKRLSTEEISSYLDSGEWQGKAGGYGIQGLAASFIQQLKGSYSAVMGLDLFQLATVLSGHRFGLISGLK